MCVPGKTNDVNVKAFNMITKIYEAETLIKYISQIVNENSIVQHAIQIKNQIMINANASVKNIVRAKKIIVGILDILRMLSI